MTLYFPRCSAGLFPNRDHMFVECPGHVPVPQVVITPAFIKAPVCKGPTCAFSSPTATNRRRLENENENFKDEGAQQNINQFPAGPEQPLSLTLK